MPGRKLMVEFDPADVGQINSFEITVTPYCKSILGNQQIEQELQINA